MISTTVARTASEIERLRPLWLELERRPGMTLYQTYRWNHAAARLLRGAQPCVVAVENSDGAAILPTADEGDALTFLGDVLFDYRDVLSSDEGALAEAWRVVAEWQRPLRFLSMRADSPHHFWMAGTPEPFCGAPSISLDDISADEFAHHHWRQAKQVRHLFREGARLVHADGTHSALVRWIYQQKAGQLAGNPNNAFADPSRIEFMVEMAAQEAARCDAYGFEMGGSIISTLITFLDEIPGARAVRRYYTTTFDPRHARLSPGIALLYEVARQSLAEGVDVDFQTGEQFHKSRLATRSTQLYRVALAAEQVAAMSDSLTTTIRAAA